MASKGKPVVDRERCKGCYLCIESCPTKVLDVEDAPNAWGYYPMKPAREEKCIACGNCYAVCPDVAVVVYKL